MATVTVTVSGDPNAYTATVNPMSLPASTGDLIDWDIDLTAANGFPTDAVVYLQFFVWKGVDKKDDNGCLSGGNGKGKHKGSSNGNKKQKIDSDVDARPKQETSYPYMLRYEDAKGKDLGMLIDPEIVVDGNDDRHPPKDKAKAKKKAKKASPPRKAKKASKAKKAPRAAKKSAKPKAKKSAKRKAKKR